jgi:coenzyme F420-0:L-glutamate ligase / coenzyme F420-1:gamma-L-glutamate ligase
VNSLCFTALAGLPEVQPGDDLAALLANALQREDLTPADNDVLVVCQKIVSKAEGRYVRLAGIEPSARARELATQCGKDARLVELVLHESSDIVRVAPNVLIARHRRGWVVANAGIDQSNLPNADGERALLLPADPDASAALLRERLQRQFGARIAVLICDSFGRPWRLGVCGVCIGCSGLAALHDLRGEADRGGRALQVTQIAVADEIAAAATLIAGEAAEGRPAILVRGVPPQYFHAPRPAADLLRPTDQDLFR